MKDYDVKSVLERAKLIWNMQQDQELAEHLQISRNTLASWKRRDSIPTKYLFRILLHSNTTMDWLLSGDNDTTSKHIGPRHPVIDNKVLWLSLLVLRRNLARGDTEDKIISELLTPEKLDRINQLLRVSIADVVNLKEKWEASDLLNDDGIYKAIALELNLDLKNEIEPGPDLY